MVYENFFTFDHSSIHKEKRTYFYSGMAAYFLGLAATIFVMHVFKHAQPALLYLVPVCIGLPVVVALIKGEIKTMFAYVIHIIHTYAIFCSNAHIAIHCLAFFQL